MPQPKQALHHELVALKEWRRLEVAKYNAAAQQPDALAGDAAEELDRDRKGSIEYSPVC